MSDQVDLEIDDTMFEKGELPPKWVRLGLIFLVISLVLTILGSGAGIALYVIDDSLSIFSYGLVCLLDIICTILVLWRLQDRKVMKIDGQQFTSKRDRQASVLISLVFVATGIAIAIHSIVSAATRQTPETAKLMILLSAISLTFWVLLGCVKFYIAVKLKSVSYRKDAVVTLASAAICVGILIAGLLFRLDQWYWWVDSAVGFLVSIFLLGYAFSTLLMNSWTNRDFWRRD